MAWRGRAGVPGLELNNYSVPPFWIVNVQNPEAMIKLRSCGRNGSITRAEKVRSGRLGTQFGHAVDCDTVVGVGEWYRRAAVLPDWYSVQI